MDTSTTRKQVAHSLHQMEKMEFDVHFDVLRLGRARLLPSLCGSSAGASPFQTVRSQS